MADSELITPVVSPITTCLLAIVTGLIISCVAKWSWKRYTFLKSVCKVPSLIMTPLPLLGNLHQIPWNHEDIIPFIFQLIKKNYLDKGMALHELGVRTLWLGPKPVLCIFCPDIAEKLLTSTVNIKKADEYDFMEEVVGVGLFTSTGTLWHNRRKLLTPTFHFRILEDFLHIMNFQCNKMVQHLEKKADTDLGFEIYPFLILCSLDIICETAMGVSINAQENSDSEYPKTFTRLCDIITSRFINPLYRVDWIYRMTPTYRDQERCIKIIYGASKEVMQVRREKRRHYKQNTSADEGVEGMKKRQAFLDLLLDVAEQGADLSDRDIQEEVNTFISAGHESTSVAVLWTIFALGTHLEHQDKVHEELDSVFGDSDRAATPEDLKQLKYLECCIKETLRLNPPAPLIARRSETTMELGGYSIPAGVSLIIPIILLHRDKRNFKDTDTYNPENFFPENCLGRHPYSYIPFSAGLRSCIGQKFAMLEMKVMVSSILRKFNVKTMNKVEDLRVRFEVFLKPDVPIKVKFSRRSPPS